MIKILKSKLCEEQLEELGLFCLEKERLERGVITGFENLKGCQLQEACLVPNDLKGRTSTDRMFAQCG